MTEAYDSPEPTDQRPRDMRRAAHKVIQIATIGYGMANDEIASGTEQLVVLTESGELFICDLSIKGSMWESLLGPIPGENIGRSAHADQEPLRYK